MIHLISFLVKAIMTIVFVMTCGVGLILLAIVLWDQRYINIAGTIQNEYIWGGKPK
jgi:hypothetical protein